MSNKELSDAELLADAGLKKYYSTSEAAKILGRGAQWIYWGLRSNRFTYENGEQIKVEVIGKNRRRYSLETIKEIAMSSYRSGGLSKDELVAVLRRIEVEKLEEGE